MRLLIRTFLLYPAFMDALIKVYFYIPIWIYNTSDLSTQLRLCNIIIVISLLLEFFFLQVILYTIQNYLIEIHLSDGTNAFAKLYSCCRWTVKTHSSSKNKMKSYVANSNLRSELLFFTNIISLFDICIASHCTRAFGYVHYTNIM